MKPSEENVPLPLKLVNNGALVNIDLKGVGVQLYGGVRPRIYPRSA